MEVKELLCLLDERLVQHDNSRKEVQDRLQSIYSESIKEADLLEERLNEKLQQYFNSTEERILSLIDKLNNKSTSKNQRKKTINYALTELSIEPNFEVEHIEDADNFGNSYDFKIDEYVLDVNIEGGNDNRNEIIIKQLQEHLDKIHETITSAQNKLTEICTNRRTEAEEFKKKIDGELEWKFNTEDNRLQVVISELRDNNSTTEDVFKAIQRAKTALLVRQSYEIVTRDDDDDDDSDYDEEDDDDYDYDDDDDRDDNGSEKDNEEEKSKFSLMNMYELKSERNIYLKIIDFEERKPSDLIVSFTDKGEFSLYFTFFGDDEIEILKTTTNTLFNVELKIWEKDKYEEENAKLITREYNVEEKQIYLYNSFYLKTTYNLKIRINYQKLSSKWSDETEFTTPEFKDLCVWEECPEYVDDNKKYFIDENNPRVAIFVGDEGGYCSTIVGNTFLPPNKLTSWNIKVLKSGWNNNGLGIYIGVAPFDINQDGYYNYLKCGWYFYCYESTLLSGPPHNYELPGKSYGPRKEDGKYVHKGDSVGVIMDTTKGELSFVVNGVNLGVAYEGIPLDKPLVPCVLLYNEGDSVELDISEIKEYVDMSISFPPNITPRSDTWDSITIKWDAVEEAEFYQIEVDGKMLCDIATTNSFTKWSLLPDTEHNIRVRAVKDNKVSEWSDVVKGRTTKIPDFTNCVWKECLDDDNNRFICSVDEKYSVDNINSRIATKISIHYDGYCTIIGNVPLPLNKVTSWNIKILKSLNNNGGDICIGVAPFDINLNNLDNSFKCGWYLSCNDSTLISGPPHNYSYKYKGYGPRKEDGEYVHTGDSVGVVMDTTKGELSFVVNGVNYGVAYKGIPLDKPLVPCVILRYKGDSVELNI